jgi:ligand-binding sensor domain-containing protein/signal transduction histidine kinase
MVRHRFFPVLLYCLLPLAGSVPAAVARERFESWTSEDGLPQNSVDSILQTRDGYLWFTTRGGLVRYDGVRFTVFNRSNSAGITSNRFTTLYEDAEGGLWIGTEARGLTRYWKGTFKTYTTEDGLPDMQIKAIRGDKAGQVWVVTDGGLSKWTGERFILPAPQELSPEQLLTIRTMRRQTGMSFFDSAGFHSFVQGKFRTYTTRDGLSSLNINSVYEDQHGTFWIETKDKGLNRLKDDKVTVYPIQASAPNDETRITAVYEDRRGNLWIARRGQGLSRQRGHLVETFTVANGLPSNDIETIFEDREGNIWLGTFNNGLCRVTDQVFTVYSQKDGLANPNVYPMLEDRAGNIWIGTWGGDLYRLKDNRFEHYGKEQGLSYQAVGALFEDVSGTLWVGTFGGGVNRLVDGQFVSLTRQDGMPDDNIRAITQDAEGSIWFGTTNGLARLNEGKVSTFGTADGLPDKEVQALTIDRHGNLWIGTLGGVARFRDGRFTRYTENDGLSSNYIRVIHEDRDGVIWIGTYDGGLSRLKDGHIRRITMQDGLYDNGVFQILEDDQDNFWMSCNRGVYRVSRKELNAFADGLKPSVSSVHYGKADGLLNTECNGGTQPAGFRARDGKMWFPTQGGIAVVDPRVISSNELPPPVAIEDFMLDNRPEVFHQEAQIPVGLESFEIHYTGLSFVRPEQVRFKYKLEGLDKDWIDVGTRRTAYYSHVPPGNYTFMVVAANSDGVWNTTGASIRIRVVPPFWRTWWFFTLEFLALAALLFFVYQRRTSQLRKRNVAQQAFSKRLIESQEGERKRIAVELHDSIGQNLLVIKNRAMMGLIAPDDGERARRQLDEISATASESIEEVRKIAYNLHPYQLDSLGLTKALASMLKRASESSLILFSCSIDEIDDLLPKEFEINLFRVVQESVNNIIKHSGATEARVRIQKVLPNILLNIQDNGKGFLVTDAAAEQTSGGLGLKGIRERVRILGGRCTIESDTNKGTIITVTIRAGETDEWTNGRNQ